MIWGRWEGGLGLFVIRCKTKINKRKRPVNYIYIGMLYTRKKLKEKSESH